ncbi:hypothetical protein A3Q56_06048, partial [Intoshia linei]
MHLLINATILLLIISCSISAQTDIGGSCYMSMNEQDCLSLDCNWNLSYMYCQERCDTAADYQECMCKGCFWSSSLMFCIEPCYRHDNEKNCNSGNCRWDNLNMYCQEICDLANNDQDCMQKGCQWSSSLMICNAKRTISDQPAISECPVQNIFIAFVARYYQTDYINFPEFEPCYKANNEQDCIILNCSWNTSSVYCE